MAVTHTHKVHKEEPPKGSTHVDSYGTPFGAEEHKAAAATVKTWPEDTAFAEVEHRHKNVRVAPHPESMVDLWTYGTPKADEDVPEPETETEAKAEEKPTK